MKRRFEFDADYYARFYENARTRVAGEREAARLVQLVAAQLGYLGQPVKRVLDVGCGLGHLRAPITRAFRSASYTGVEHSEYLCERYGWTQGSVVDYRPRAPRSRFDLVICRGVLQYLTRPQAVAAIDNLAELCGGVLYLEALTREDWEDAADRKRTDGAVYLRPASFYRKQLARAGFHAAGLGLYVHERSNVVLYALETL